MHRVDILLTDELDVDMTPFVHAHFKIQFHHWSTNENVPWSDGTTWAFVNWTLPSISGLEVCRRLRCNPQTANIHITMILDEDNMDARRRALRAGADDYMLGPVSRTAVLDRVLSSQPISGVETNVHLVELGQLIIDVAAFEARWQGKPIPLMPNEYRLLRFLMENSGRVYTRAQLIAAIGKQSSPIDERTVDVWIGRLRRALRAAGAVDPIRTVRSLGYVLNKP